MASLDEVQQQEHMANSTSEVESVGMADKTEMAAGMKVSEKDKRPDLTFEMKQAVVKEMHTQVGTAAVKLEYVDFNKISNAFVRKCQPGAESTKEESKSNCCTSEPPLKKSKKNRGRNKHRPRDSRPEPKDNICQYIATSRDCPFAERCTYLHDVKTYLTNKPPDIKETCYNFETFGKCPFGISCRFSGQHTNKDGTNIIDAEKCNRKSESVTRNILNQNLKVKLRKKQYNFPKSEAYLNDLKSKKGNQQRGNLVFLAEKKGNENAQECSSDLKNKIVSSKEGESFFAANQQSLDATGNTHGILVEDGVTPVPILKKKIDFSNKLYLAPLTTVGNLPFRRVCKRLGADITCGEMAMCTNLLQGHPSEWALLKRHSCEDAFGVQICGSFADTMSKCTEMINNETDVDFIDINVGCPIDLVFKKGAGSALMCRMTKFEEIVRGMVKVSDVPITVKMRAGIDDKHFTAHKIIPKVLDWGASLVTVHGRTREQRYTRAADWDYLEQCATTCGTYPFLGNGDIFSFEDINKHKDRSGIAGTMIARGALIKPWIFTEAKEQRHWDISSSERFSILQDFTNFGLEHWGSDQQGVDKTRRFMLEWLSFLYRYIPVGILERVPQRINERPPQYFGRDHLETLMASPDCKDWIKISEMLLGPVPDSFQFLPKHKANSYSIV
ncbi:tRNA-dihydrouridine(47) synthase [NAD(P)(+)]-like [Anneissia japonica]|uniref:tRNA-dihydrouridine(47) synthase [NAD(P)(+)]-like n=1 Tax=Anneissia japonica TaxID=1529436 RepID=UPI0014258814|nr:tRNA-dihydrouridine(47) synthase [NAD(P)(+)]-like [Anneissia japonica]